MSRKKSDREIRQRPPRLTEAHIVLRWDAPRLAPELRPRMAQTLAAYPATELLRRG